MAADRSIIASLAYWGAVAGASLAIFGILGIQIRLLQPITGFYFFGLGTLVGGGFSLVMGLVALATTRTQPEGQGRRRAWRASGAGFVLVGAVAASAVPGMDFPPINDITTNLEDPPAFAPPSRVPAYAGFDMHYPADFVAVVREGYPDLETVEIRLAPGVAYARAISTARLLGWEITDEDPEAGRFDASQTTQFFRFVDDITVRIRPINSGSLIDIRSRSRVGRGDLGANATRIREFSLTLLGD